MKKLLSCIIALSLILTMFTIPAAAAAAKLTAAETNIVKAYQKSVETGDVQYISKYKYPGVSFFSGQYEKGMKLKILNAQYSKVYDSKAKLNKLMIKGLLVITDGEMLGFGNVNWGIFVKTKNKKLYAYKEVQNADEMKFLKIDDLSEGSISAMEKYLVSLYGEDTAYSLMYPEEDSAGADEEDTITNDEDTITNDDEDTINNNDEDTSNYEENTSSNQSNNSSAKGKGTLSSPIEVNQKYTWNETKDFLGDTLSATYSFTVTNVKKLSLDELHNLGFKETKDGKYELEYALLDIDYEVKDGTLKKGTGDGYAYFSAFKPNFYGMKTADGISNAMGVSDYGFDTSITKAISDAGNSKKVTPGSKESFKVKGKVVVVMIKGKTNCLVLRNQEIKDYNSSMIYFKLN